MTGGMENSYKYFIGDGGWFSLFSRFIVENDLIIIYIGVESCISCAL